MKKLMMIAAVLAATVLNAATVDWKVTVDTADKQKKFMFFNYEDQADVLAILDAGGANTYAQLEALAYSATGVYQFNTTAKSTSKSGGLSDISKGDNMFVVLFDTTAAGTVTDGMAYKYTDKLESSAWVYDGDAEPPESSPGTFAIGAASFANSGTVAAAVPEPTSGLLLLLGMAGLALRRKQA